MDFRSLFVASLLVLGVFAPLASSGSLGAYGTIAGPTTPGLSGSYTSTIAAAGAQIIYQDDGATATVLDTTEAVFLDLDANGQADAGDVQLSAVGPGAAGSYITEAITTNLQAATGGTAVKTLLRYHDSLPAYANGGPDGVFGPGETLFLDVNKNTFLDTGDVILASGTPGSRQASAGLDTVFHKGGTECVYAQGTAAGTAAVEAGMIRVSTACAAGTSGSAVAVGNADVGASLQSMSSVVISGGDATFTAGEFAWVGTGAVANAHYRLVTNGGLAVGTIADCQVSAVGHTAADADCATATTVMSAYVSMGAATFPAIAFPALGRIDLNGDNTLSSTDRLYFDFDGDGRVSSGDIRAATSTGFSFGTRPNLADADMQAFLIAPAAQPIAIYLDAATGTVGTVDTNEVVALSLDGDDHFDFGDVPLITGSGCTAGLPRQGTTTCGNVGTWRAVTTATPAGALMYHDVLAPGGTATRGDGLYIHFGGGTTAGANDIRIAESIIGGTSYAGGARVPSSGSDFGITLTALTGGVLGTEFKVGLLDVDGSASETRFDLPYLELGTGNLRAGAVDARLHNQHSLTFGKYLSDNAATDKDAILELVDLAATVASDFAFFDLDGGGGLSLSDPVIARVPEGACGSFDANDIRMSAGSKSAAAGTPLAAGSESGVACTDLATAVFAFAPSSQPYSSTSSVILDLAANSKVSIGDVRISGSNAGNKVQSSDVLLNSAVTSIPFGAIFSGRPAAAMLSFVDLNGNGALDGTEALVFDVDGNNLFSSGDILLTGTGGSTTLPAAPGGSGGGGGAPAQTTTTTTPASGTTTVTTTVDPVVVEEGTTTATVTVGPDGNPSSPSDNTAGAGETDGSDEAVPIPAWLAFLAIGLALFAVRRRL